MNQSINIHSLPLEILSMILENLEEDRPSLTQSALVHTSWSAPSLHLLYRDIHISTRKRAAQLARWSIHHHIEKSTVSLYVGTDAWTGEIEIVLRACVRLETLSLPHRLNGVPSNILQYPSLRNLQTLTLLCKFKRVSAAEEQLLASQMAAPTRLQSLSVLLNPNNLPGILNLISTCVSEPAPTLRRFTILEGHEHLTDFSPLAPILTSFWPALCDVDTTSCRSPTDFLSEARNLLHLRFSEGESSIVVSHYLQALQCQLQSLTLQLNFDYADFDNASVLKAVRGAAGTKALEALSWIKFRTASLRELESIKGWDDLVTVLQRNGTRIVTEC